jgi:hypothetical protein
MKATGPALPAIADRIRTVADFYTANKPTVHQIRVFAEDFEKLSKCDYIELRKYGFNKSENGAFSYHDFDLIPVDGPSDAPPEPPRPEPKAARG